MTPAKPVGAQGSPGPFLDPSANPSTLPTGNNQEPSFAGIPIQPQAQPVPGGVAHQPSEDSCTQQEPNSNLKAPGPAGEWADALLSTALRNVSSDGLSSSLRPSPGLAARLKALGFGTKTSPPPTPAASGPSPNADRVGRLDQHQLRQLDQSHQQNSKAPVVERRGRPWKGLGFSLASRPPSSCASLPSPGLVTEAGETESVPSGQAPSPVFLPEIDASPPLNMDTNKYRLPDHVNGNGTKVQLDTRREHIERSVLPPSPNELPPPPPAKDSPPPSSGPTPPISTTPSLTDFTPNLSSYFTPGHQRPGSIYTLSRLSFANQLAQLTALQLPDAGSLSSKVASIPTAQAATTALINAAEQIRSWISKASEVINGLDSDDDVEWAAAGGREGLAEVEKAILRFEELINAYVSAIEGLQNRGDIAQVASDDLNHAVFQMESIMEEWTGIRSSLHVVKEQVEIAMEWEELWNNVLGDIQSEMDELVRLVFEMEERRHKSLMVVASGEGVDIGDLETIVEETPSPGNRLRTQPRFSLPAFPLSPNSPGGTAMSADDSSLLGLFARMQPLRASLDFLPMRLSVFQTRAERSFPGACEELEMKRDNLDAAYQKLEKDAESLRKELGEDRWVLVFRGAGRQAYKMYESVERSVAKLREALDAGLQLTNQPLMGKKIESYDAKKTHYGPAIERVLGIIDKGVKDRLTVNGEILRLHQEIQSKWDALKEQMGEMDATVEDLQSSIRGSQQLRDSISSILSNDRSTTGSGRETPGSSPPSSVIMTSLGLDPSTPSAKIAKHRSPSQMANRRHSALPSPSQGPPRKANLARLSVLATPANVTTPAAKAPRPMSTLSTRPPWRAGVNSSHVDTGHNFKPLSLTSPSPYSKKTPTTPRWAVHVRITDAFRRYSHQEQPKTLVPRAHRLLSGPILATNHCENTCPKLHGIPRVPACVVPAAKVIEDYGRFAPFSAREFPGRLFTEDQHAPATPWTSICVGVREEQPERDCGCEGSYARS
ncbi:related to MUC1 Extracellular alpha-1,4-glucan glucosidase [Cephalotrichum gorgonifer]|uniref:Related to MUC1 Extracellular alpha-1,4-glucan glucosidase n=1 Tax=Cephalotrichum gorgonifer TaxID=2041049 RepID=A0AAE8MXH3_9PEZI|nr:related to MUC1 Extracellular alpha-1,4-glucan glucosidase [Cephalotrichum gorgonifer]